MKTPHNSICKLSQITFIFILLISCLTSRILGQSISISGPTCAVGGSTYTYTVSGAWSMSTSMTWSVTNGVINGSSSGTPRPSISVTWNAGFTTGTVRLNTTNPTSGPILNITGAPALTPGTISNPTQNINYNAIPGTINAGAAAGGDCSPTYQYQWQQSTNNVTYTDISGATGLTLSFSSGLTQPMYYKRKVTVGGTGAISYTLPATVFVYPQLNAGLINPQPITINSGTSPGTLVSSGVSGGSGVYTYRWLNSNSPTGFVVISGATSSSYTPPALTATTYYQVEVTSNGIVASSASALVTVVVPSGVQPASNTLGDPNSEMNWVISRKYDEAGNMFFETKNFYNNAGSLLQQQNKSFYRKNSTTVYNHVLAKQPLRDVYGRDAAVTLSAPIDYADFIYKPTFVLNTAGTSYDYRKFDRSNPSGSEIDNTNTPEQVGGQSVKGTLGWYYGTSNDWEPYTPITNFPYSRQTYYRDGTGTDKKLGGVGEPLVMGSGHEMSIYVTPLYSELNHYLQVRNKFFTLADMGNQPSTLQNQGQVKVTHDMNGVDVIEIKDAKGNTLMTGRPGTELLVSNSIVIQPGNFIYFKLLGTTNVSVSGSLFSVYNMDNIAESKIIGFTSGTSLSAGYYKVSNNEVSTPITLAYTNGLANVSYSFYNQLGELIASIPPEGVKKLYSTGINNYAVKENVPFISLYEYNLQGQISKKTDPDQGISRSYYRTDGKIRFSQNAIQAASGSFSYTNYDLNGRTLEGGQYTPDGTGIVFGSATMSNILENTSVTGGLTSGTKSTLL